MAITREVLATAQRDLRALAMPPALALARDRRRALARYGDVDEAWLKDKRAQVDMLAGAAACSVPREPEEWFEGVVDLVRLVYGAAAAAALDAARVRLTSLGAERRRRRAGAHRRARLVARDGRGAGRSRPRPARRSPRARARAPGSRAPHPRARRAPQGARVARGPGRRRRRDLAAPLRDRSFAAVVREAGRNMVRALPAARDPELREKTLTMLAFYGLTFRIGDDGVPLLSPEDIEKAIAKKSDSEELAKSKLTLAQALALVELPVNRFQRRHLAEWVAQGLELELVVRAAEGGPRRRARTCAERPRGPGVRDVGDAPRSPLPRARDHVRALARALHASAEERGRRGPRGVPHGARAQPGRRHAGAKTPPPDPIAVLDATLGMFSKLPAKAAGILDRLKGTTPGAGRRAFPELAEWLGDDALLDRFVHLAHICRRAGRPREAASRGLRARRQGGARAGAPRGDASSLGPPGGAPRRRSRRATARSQRRREGERSAASQSASTSSSPSPTGASSTPRSARSSATRGASPSPSLTQAWRDAVRFWLVVDDNRELLGRLLREAADAPGRDVKLTFAKNREWIAKTQTQLRLAAVARAAPPGARGRGHHLRGRARGRSARGAAHGHPLRDLPRARHGLQRSVDGAQRDRREQARALRPRARRQGRRAQAHRDHEGAEDCRVQPLRLDARPGRARDPRRGRHDVPRDLERGRRSARGHRRARADPRGLLVRRRHGSVGRGRRRRVVLPLARPRDAAEVVRRHRDRGARPPRDRRRATSTRRSRSSRAGTAAPRTSASADGSSSASASARRCAARRSTIRSRRPSCARSRARARRACCARWRRRPASTSTRPRTPYPRCSRRFRARSRLAAAIADTAVRALRVFPRSNDHGLVHVTMNVLDQLLDGVADSFDALDRVEPAWRAFTQREVGCEPCRIGAWERCVAAVRLGVCARARS